VLLIVTDECGRALYSVGTTPASVVKFAKVGDVVTNAV
jgi:hypothetical protein